MATYSVTTSNWNSGAFWSGVSTSGTGNTLDFGGLPSNYTVEIDDFFGAITLSDGTSTYIVGDSASGVAADATLGGSSLLSHFDTISASAGDDTVDGGSGDDLLGGGAGDDTIDGGTETDTVIFSGASSEYTFTLNGDGTVTVVDTVSGRDGTDTVANVEFLQFSDGLYELRTDANDGNENGVVGGANSGSPYLLLGDGDNDNLVSYDGGDLVVGGGGNDYVNYANATPGSGHVINLETGANTDGDTLIGIEGAQGTTGNDTITGSSGNDILLSGFGGDDSIEGGDGADVIWGDHSTQFATTGGNDTLSGGAGNDTIYGHSGNDTLIGGTGDDSLSGGDGDDFLKSGSGQDTLDGGAGNDTLMNAAGDDSLVGGAGDDLIVATQGNDTLEGGTGNDTLMGGTDNDSLDGGADNDLLLGDLAGVEFNATGTDGVGLASGISDFPTTELTYEITFSSTDSTGDTPLASYTEATGGTNDFLILASAGTLRVYINNAMVDTGISTAGLFDGDIHTLAVTWDSGSGALDVYVDGAPGYSGTFQTGQTIQQGGTFAFGQEQDAVGGGFDTIQIFDGTIYGARLYDDVRTATEIADTVHAPVADPSDSNLIANWVADPDSATFTDQTGSHAMAMSGDVGATWSAGDDTLRGGAGEDTLYGGGGDDTFEISGGIAAGERLVNGSFDDGTDGWTINNPSGGDAPGPLAGGDNLSFNTGNETTYGDSAEQEFGTISGSSYTLTLHATANGSSGDTHTLQVDILDSGGNVLATETRVVAQGSDETVTFSFTAVSDESTIRISNPTSTGSGGTDLIVTDVSVIGDAPDDDLASGGEDADTFIVQDNFGNDTVVGGEGGTDSDTIDLSGLTGPITVTYTGPEAGTITDGTDTITFSEIENLILTDQADSVDGTSDSAGLDIDAGDGDDSILGGSGTDTIDAGDGNDTVNAGWGNESVFGGDGDDRLDGGGQNDTIYGGAGNDTIDASDGSGRDLLFGDAGNDDIDIGNGQDTAYGGDDADIIRSDGSSFSKEAYGGEGGLDDDTLSFASEADAADTISVTFSGDVAGTVAIRGQTVTFSEFENIEGTQGSDSIDASGDSSGMGLSGDGGDDTIIGGSGDDVIYGDQDEATLRDPNYGGNLISNGGFEDGLNGWTVNNPTGGEAPVVTTGEAARFNGGNEAVYGDSIEQDFTSSIGDQHTLALDLIELTGNAVSDQTFQIDILDDTGAVIATETHTVTDGTTLPVSFSFVPTSATSTLRITNTNATESVGADGFVDNVSITNTTQLSGDDSLDGGAGNDTIIGGTGNDSLTGDLGDDLFVYNAGDGHDTITDFNSGNSGALGDGDSTNNDFIDLSSYYTNIFELRADFDDDGVLNQSNDGVGSADYSDNTSLAGGSLTFSGSDRESFQTDNTGVVCFAAGTLILTEKGEVPVQQLRPDDKIVTMDNGIQPLAMVSARRLDTYELAQNPALKPIELKPGALGFERRLIVSPQHAMLLRTRQSEELVAARQLSRLGGSKCRVMKGCREITYYHLIFDAHQIVFANGRPAESFFPGKLAISALGVQEMREFARVLPDTVEGKRIFRPARRKIKMKDLENLKEFEFYCSAGNSGVESGFAYAAT